MHHTLRNMFLAFHKAEVTVAEIKLIQIEQAYKQEGHHNAIYNGENRKKMSGEWLSKLQHGYALEYYACGWFCDYFRLWENAHTIMHPFFKRSREQMNKKLVGHIPRGQQRLFQNRATTDDGFSSSFSVFSTVSIMNIYFIKQIWLCPLRMLPVAGEKLSKLGKVRHKVPPLPAPLFTSESPPLSLTGHTSLGP